MKAKKLTAGLLAMTLMGAMALPVSAEEQTTELTASVESEYILTIPSETEIIFENTSTPLNGKLKVTGNVLPTQTVSVSAKLNPLHNAVRNTDLPYKLMNGTEEFQTTVWNEAELRAEQPKELQLSVNITADDWKQAKAGDYAGSIVFTATMQP